jgi:ribosomal-protein-alanine N-acetyltransferase
MKLSGFLGSGPLLLEQLTVVHATERYLEWMNDPQVTRFLESRFSPPADVDALKAFICDCDNSPTDLLLGIFLSGTGQHIGNIKLGPINPHHKTGEIGLLIGERSCWGKGYAVAAIAILADHAFETLGLVKLTAGCYAENVGSTRAFQRSGFQIEGRRAMQWDCDGLRQDGILLGMVNPAWHARD